MISSKKLYRADLAAFVLLLAVSALGCGTNDERDLPPSTGERPRARLDGEGTAYGFFPVPPRATLESILDHFEDLSRHADFLLFQQQVPWEDFRDGVEGESKSRTDLRNQITLARRNGLAWAFVVDPLNGLNRHEFMGLPDGWEPSFANPDVRDAFTHFTLWLVREFEPRFLGLSSEINTYLDAFPAEMESYLSLYRDVYDRVKSEAPDTRVFVTFQWDDLNNMFPGAAEGRPAGRTNWSQVEAFEPRLDLWAISSYPYFIFEDGAIPADYYTPLLKRTSKPIAVTEGGWTTASKGPVRGSESGQVAYLEAVHDQLGERLELWVYLLLNDLDMESFGGTFAQSGRSDRDIETLRLFVHLGLRTVGGSAKPALTLWDRYREWD